MENFVGLETYKKRFDLPLRSRDQFFQLFDLRPKLRFLLLELLVRQQRESPLVRY